MVAGEAISPQAQQYILTINKENDVIKLNHSPFMVGMGVENLQATGVVDSGAGLCVASEIMVKRIQNIHPDRIIMYQQDLAIRGANNSKIQVLRVVQLNF